jgi:pimeloyl-ACP methyl ester carboxylesterase
MTTSAPGDALAAVSRTVPEGTETLGYLSLANPDLFCRLLSPIGPRGGVLIVPDYSVARSWSAAKERELSTEVARRGHASLLFDYRGEGRSRSPNRPGLEALAHDVESALGVLGHAVPISVCTVVGLGLGGVIATLTLTEHEAPLATWGRPQSGCEFFFDLMRQRLMRQMGFSPNGDSSLLDRVAADILDEELDRGTVDLLGFSIPAVVVAEVCAEARRTGPAETFEEAEPASSVAEWACQGESQ